MHTRSRAAVALLLTTTALWWRARWRRALAAERAGRWVDQFTADQETQTLSERLAVAEADALTRRAHRRAREE